MSSSDKTRRRFLALALLLPLLSGCSFTPLYGGGQSSTNAGKGFAYGEPNNRYEQIIYQELAFRLGTDPSPDAVKVKVYANKTSRRVGRTSASSVLTAYEAIVTATMQVDGPGDDEKKLLSVNRFASASYDVSGQIAADRAATDNAGEQAARSLADTLRPILAAARNKGDF